MAKTIPFPRPPKRIPDIDWTEISLLRELLYPKIPKKALAMLQKIFDKKRSPALVQGSYVMVHHTEPGYPPDPLPVRRHKHHILWLMELLDRFGGELSDGKTAYTVKRKVKRPPVFLVQEISRETKLAISEALGHKYERFAQREKWRLYGKDLPDTDLSMYYVQGLQEERYFVGWFDRETASSMFARLEEGATIEEVMMIG